jgi:hypothetical protein
MHEEAVLKRAAHPVDVTEVVDRGATRVDAITEHLDYRLAQAGILRA